MEIKEGKNRFYVTDAVGHEIGEVTYSAVRDSVLSIDHTVVDPQYRGRQIAQQLIKAVVDKAVGDHKQIIPACSYAKAQFARVKDYQQIEFKG
ncbi:GNAT family N-acetyltransferase [Sporolactobacillus sp. KGMB 08714]|uniref:GNAT family N-acetyltransferase n=1 Tax=Sporolactobacillus sp. KGMB 08714 TaxID=3064704 RepID=UPI002FBD4999